MEIISKVFKPITPITPINNSIQQNQDVTNQNNGFKDILNKAIETVNQTGNESYQDAISIITGQSDAPHNILISGEEARIALELTLAIRTKAIDAYNEIMRMQI